jgi:hypothetical protein
MSSRLLTLLFLISGIHSVEAQKVNLDWAKIANSKGNVTASWIHADKSGDFFVLGSFKDSHNFNPDGNAVKLTSAGDYDMYIARYDSSCAPVWIKQIGGQYTDMIGTYAFDASGNIYIAGSFKTAIDLNPSGAGGKFTVSGVNADIFVAKYDASAKFLWAKQMGGPNVESVNGLHVSSTGTIYMTGSFKFSSDFNPGGSGGALTSAGDADAYVCVLNSSGDFTWVKAMGGFSIDGGNSIMTDAAGNIFSTGSFRATADFNPGADTNTMRSIFNGNDYEFNIYVSKLDPQGNYLWARRLDGESGKAKMDAAGNIYISGEFHATRNLDPARSAGGLLTSAGYYDDFICKLNPAGDFLWVKQLAGKGDNGLNNFSLDPSGNIYITGIFNDSIDCDPGPGKVNFVSEDLDAAIIRINSSGDFEWARHISGSGNEYGGQLAIGPWGHVYSTGRIRGTVDFNKGGTPLLLSSGAQTDESYLLKLSQPGYKTGIDTKKDRPSLSIYPNPAQAYLTIMRLIPGASISVIDINGKSVIELIASAENMQLRVEGLNSGVYFLMIRSGDQSYQEKLIINK